MDNELRITLLEAEVELSRLAIQEQREYIFQLERALYQQGHVLEQVGDTWALAHPVACRATSLLNCLVSKKMFSLDVPPVSGDGQFPVTLGGDGELVFLLPEES